MSVIYGILATLVFIVTFPTIVIFILWVVGNILVKAGFHRAWSLIVVVPVINIFCIWVFAFKKWPNQIVYVEFSEAIKG